MFVILGLPLALLAGHATDALFATDAAAFIRRFRAVLLRVVIVVAILAGGFALRSWWQGADLRFHIYWLSLLFTVPAMFALLSNAVPRRAHWSVGCWIALLLVDAWALTLPLVATRPQAELFPASASVARLAETPPGQARVLDRDGLLNADGSPLGYGAPLALLYQIEAVRGYTPLDHARYKEYLQLIADGDEPLTAFHSSLAFPVINDFPLVHRRLLDLLGVRYLLVPDSHADVAAAVGGGADPMGGGVLATLAPLTRTAANLPPGADCRLILLDTTATAYNLDRGGVRASALCAL